jgi:hypothetical protein
MKANGLERIGERGAEASLLNSNGAKPDSWETVVQKLVGTLRFGVVQITVHESHVVQVERTEKVRFAQPTPQKPNR